MEMVWRSVPVTSVKVGQVIAGHGPHSEFQGGRILAVNFQSDGTVLLKIQTERWSRVQGRISPDIRWWSIGVKACVEALFPLWSTLPTALRS